jgi:hypothetical protein
MAINDVGHGLVMKLVGEDSTGEDLLAADNGYTMCREYSTVTPGGNLAGGRWVLRDPMGEYVDVNQYRHDLLEHHNFRTHY